MSRPVRPCGSIGRSVAQIGLVVVFYYHQTDIQSSLLSAPAHTNKILQSIPEESTPQEKTRKRRDTMISRKIQCTYCGWKGMAGRGNHHDSDEPTFRYLGRNHLSGHLHYQCPVCSVVSLVPPMGTPKVSFRRAMPIASSPEYRFFIGEEYGLAACH